MSDIERLQTELAHATRRRERLEEKMARVVKRLEDAQATEQSLEWAIAELNKTKGKAKKKTGGNSGSRG